jgi:hypothetical protein
MSWRFPFYAKAHDLVLVGNEDAFCRTIEEFVESEENLKSLRRPTSPSSMPAELDSQHLSAVTILFFRKQRICMENRTGDRPFPAARSDILVENQIVIS